MAALADARPAGVVLPKADSADTVRALVSALPADLPVLSLIESARGVREAAATAETPGVVQLLFGNLDFALDAGITVRSAEQGELHYARSALMVASRATGLLGPVDGVHPDVSDTEGLRAAASRARDLGFTCLLCIHPSQVEIVRRGFRPTERELAWARCVVEVAEEGNAEAVMVDGQMIDTPRWELARWLLRAAEWTRRHPFALSRAHRTIKPRNLRATAHKADDHRIGVCGRTPFGGANPWTPSARLMYGQSCDAVPTKV